MSSIFVLVSVLLLLECSATLASNMSSDFETVVLPQQAQTKDLINFTVSHFKELYRTSLNGHCVTKLFSDEEIYMLTGTTLKILEKISTPEGLEYLENFSVSRDSLVSIVSKLHTQVLDHLETIVNETKINSFIETVETFKGSDPIKSFQIAMIQNLLCNNFQLYQPQSDLKCLRNQAFDDIKKECFKPSMYLDRGDIIEYFLLRRELEADKRRKCEKLKTEIDRAMDMQGADTFTQGVITRESRRAGVCGVEFTAYVDRVIYEMKHLRVLKALKDKLEKVTPPPSGILSLTCEQMARSSLSKIVTKSRKYRVKRFEFELTEGECAPDKFVQTCYLINGQYPGPAIVVDQYDTLIVKVVNRLTTTTTMHFHGILQKHSVGSDGVEHVTQMGIQPNSSYIYEMMIGEQTGTFMYHGHVGLDLVWIHGALIIRENEEVWKNLGDKFRYDYEHTYLLEEIFHESFEKLIRDMEVDGVDDPEVASFAINGRSNGDFEVLTVKPSKIYRFRVINNAAGSMLRFSIDSHNLTIIEMDGIITEPVVTSWLDIHTGQRYSVLVTMDQPVGNYWVQARLISDDGEPGPDNGRAIVHYECAEDPGDMKKEVFGGKAEGFEISAEGWVLEELRPNGNYKQEGVYDFPERSDRVIMIDMQMRTQDGPPRYLVNGVKFEKPEKPFLTLARNGENLNHTHVYSIKKGEVVDLVLQNRVDDTGGCDSHPVHLHGHSFWVADMRADGANLESLGINGGNNRQFRDTFVMYPNVTRESNVTGAPCGYAVVRFRADNPGLWLVHCHVTSHMVLGKMFVLYEYDERNYRLINE